MLRMNRDIAETMFEDEIKKNCSAKKKHYHFPKINLYPQNLAQFYLPKRGLTNKNITRILTCHFHFCMI